MVRDVRDLGVRERSAAESALLESKLILGIRTHKDNPAKIIKFVVNVKKEGGASLLRVSFVI